MFARILLLSSFFVSSLSFASQNSAPAPIVSEIKAEPANGGINPDYTGVRLTGYVMAGGNACQASAYKASFKKTVKHGVTILVAKLTTIKEELVCPMFFDPNHKGVAFDQTIILKSSQLDKVLVDNVGREGNLVSLEFLVNANAPVDSEVNQPAQQVEDCLAPRACTMEYRPHVCTDASGNKFEGNNRCTAIEHARQAACTSGASFLPNELTCVPAQSFQ